MDNLLSNIQQGSQENDKNNLLDNQQINQEKINALLEESAEALTCGPTCQKLKVSEELKQKYLDAQANIQTAPIELEQTKKNYYIYTQGRPAYNEMQQKELVAKSIKITKMIGENFMEEVSAANTMNQYLNTALVNSDYTAELLKEYKKKNQILKLKLKDSHGDILTNDRKTYYEVSAIDRLHNWYKVFFIIFYLSFIVFILSMFLVPNQLTQRQKIIFSILLVGYPYYIDPIVRTIYGFYMNMYNNIPKNVYNDL
jgi:hypothetical protein